VAENLFEEILAENFPNLGEGTDTQIQEAQRASPQNSTQGGPHQDTK